MPVNPADKSISDAELVKLFTSDISYPPEMGFYLDENTAGKDVVLELRDQGIRVTTAQAQGQTGEVSDFLILAQACKLGLVLVTRDHDFERLHRRLMGSREEHGVNHAGIILIGHRMDDRMVVSGLARFAEKYGDWADHLQNMIWDF